MINTKSDLHGKLQPWGDYMNAAVWYRSVLLELKKALKNDGCAWVFMNWRGMSTLTKAACDAGWPIASCMVWNKTGLGTGNYLRSKYELVALFAMPDFQIKNRGIADIQEFKQVPFHRRFHSAQKPVELLKFLIENSTEERDIVLDPFMGSGSTGVACAETNRRFIGIDLDGGFCDTAKQRINETLETKGD